MDLKCILITYPLRDEALLGKLKALFPIVHFYPPDLAAQAKDHSGGTVPDIPAEVFAEAEVILTFNLPPGLTSHTQTPNLKLFQLVSAGADHILETDRYTSHPADHPLILANSSGIHVPGIAEHVLMTTLALFHGLPKTEHISRQEQRWGSPGELGMHIRELYSMKVCVAGYGHLGRQVAKLFAAFGAEVWAANRDGKRAPIGGYLIPGTGDVTGVIPTRYFSTSSPELLTECLPHIDVLVSCLPSTSATRKFFDAEKIKAMKGDALYINVGRGDACDTESLVAALQASVAEARSSETGTLRLGGAALDVTDPEPLPDKHPLFGLNNCIITPHSSYMCISNFQRAVEVACINVERLRAGRGALNALRGRGEQD